MVEILHILQVVRVAECFRIFSTIAVSKFDTSESAGFLSYLFQFSFSLSIFFPHYFAYTHASLVIKVI